MTEPETATGPETASEPETQTGTGTRERRIVLVRHGKAVPKDAAPDPERELTERGRRDAAGAGRWLEESGHRVDLAQSSTAVRARRTWQLMIPQLSDPPPAYYAERLYHADGEDLLAVLREEAPDLTGVLLVGHNPAVHELATTLCGSGPKQLRRRLEEAFPTAGVVVLTVACPWHELAPGAAHLTDFWAPGDDG
ncbi:histidine phosphatase family protein [Streptomyces sp. NPDC046866]|uniref:SixA phosphatase family protein n=1 Tax=Streptomyces sp. NPDC046866 TaxID=3154921 RepID=UPI0034535FE2